VIGTGRVGAENFFRSKHGFTRSLVPSYVLIHNTTFHLPKRASYLANVARLAAQEFDTSGPVKAEDRSQEYNREPANSKLAYTKNPVGNQDLAIGFAVAHFIALLSLGKVTGA